jgi:hypothetical protein
MRLAGCRASSRRSATRVSGSVGCAVGLGPRDGQRGLLARILGHETIGSGLTYGQLSDRAAALEQTAAFARTLSRYWSRTTFGRSVRRSAGLPWRREIRHASLTVSGLASAGDGHGLTAAPPARRPSPSTIAPPKLKAARGSRPRARGAGRELRGFPFRPAPDRRIVGVGLAPRFPARARIPPKRPHARKGDELQATWFAAWHTFHRDGTMRKD